MSYPFKDEDKKNLLMTLLKVLGGRKVRVDFDGSGDSGTIENPELFDQEDNHIDLNNATLDWYQTASEVDPLTNKWRTIEKPVPNMPVTEVLKSICEDALEEEGLDWYNNEGGYGTLCIDLTTTPPSITMDVHVRVTNTEDYEFDYTNNLDEEN
jgi:hypothetical protein